MHHSIISLEVMILRVTASQKQGKIDLTTAEMYDLPTPTSPHPPLLLLLHQALLIVHVLMEEDVSLLYNLVILVYVICSCLEGYSDSQCQTSKFIIMYVKAVIIMFSCFRTTVVGRQLTATEDTSFCIN